MATDEEKIAALKAIRDKARASRLETGEDGTFAVYDEEEDENLRRAYPEYAAGGNIRTEEEEPAEDDNDVSSREEAFAADEYLPEDDDEYDERERLSNVVEPPMLTDEGKRYLQRNPRPRRPAIATAGYGEIIVTARISSSGQVTNVSLKKRVLQHLDEAALAFVRRMPPMKPGTKGGFATDMIVNIGITFFPSYSVSMKGYSLVR